jgi:hypothetical protein
VISSPLIIKHAALPDMDQRVDREEWQSPGHRFRITAHFPVGATRAATSRCDWGEIGHG